MAGESLGEAYVEVVARLDKLQAGLEAGKRKTKQATDEMRKSAEIAPSDAAWLDWVNKTTNHLNRVNAANRRNIEALSSSALTNPQRANEAAIDVEAARQLRVQQIIADGRRRMDETMAASAIKSSATIEAENAKTASAQIASMKRVETESIRMGRIQAEAWAANTKIEMDIINRRIAANKVATAQAIDNNLSTRWMESAEATKKYTAIQAQAIEENKRFNEQLRGGAEEGNKTLERLQRTLTAIVAVMVAQKITQAFTDLVNLGMEYNKAVENARLGIATLLSTGGKFVNSGGNALEGTDKINAAYAESDNIIKQLEIDNLRTSASFEQLAKAFQLTLKPAQNVGFTLEQTRKYTTAMVQAAGALGLNLDMLAEETRSMLRGTITPRNTIIATALGITNNDIKKYRGDTEGLFNFIMSKLKEFEVFGFETQNTFSGLMSNLKDSISKLLGTATKPFFENFKSTMKEMFDSIVQVNEKTGDVKFSDEFVDKANVLNRLLNGMLTVVKDIGSFLAHLDVDPLNKVLNITSSLYDLYMKLPAGSWGLLGLLYFGAGTPAGIISGMVGIYNAIEKLKKQYNYSNEIKIPESDLRAMEQQMGLKSKGNNIIRKPIPSPPATYKPDAATWAGASGSKGAGPIGVNDIDQAIRVIEAKVASMNQNLRDQMFDLDAIIATGAGDVLGVELAKIDKWSEDAKEKVWKDIDKAQSQFIELGEKLRGKRGATPEALAQETKAQEALNRAWAVGAEQLAVVDEIEKRRSSLKIKEITQQNDMATAQYNKELGELDSNYQVIVQAERDYLIASNKIKLAQIEEALAAGTLTESQKKAYEAYKKLYDAKLKLADLKVDDTFSGGFMKSFNDWKNSFSNFDMGAKAFDRFKQAIDDAAGALADFTMTGEMDFSDFVTSILRDLIKMQYQMALMSMFGGDGSGGGIFSSIGSFFSGLFGGGTKAYAVGGEITEPIFGVGQSGRKYTFGEGGRHETVIPNSIAFSPMSPAFPGGRYLTQENHNQENVHINVNAPVNVSPIGGGMKFDKKQTEVLSNQLKSEIEATVVRVIKKHSAPGGSLNSGFKV